MVVETLSLNTAFFFSPFFFMGGGLGVVHHVYRGKLQYKPLYIHCKFILRITIFFLNVHAITQ